MEKLDTYHFPYLNNFVASSFFLGQKTLQAHSKTDIKILIG